MNQKKIIFIAIAYLILGCNSKKHQNDSRATISFEEQLETFKILGYQLNDGIDKKTFILDYQRNTGVETAIEDFEKHPYEILYYYLGSISTENQINYTNNCVTYDIEFIDPNTEYISFMKRMGEITRGEIEYRNIELYIDSNNYEWIKFEVNGVKKNWKLERTGYVSDSFFQRFSYLPQELKTIGRYTYYSDGGQQFVIDFSTEKEQKDFLEKTKLKREWLGEGVHFSKPEN
jgi:hypothetical protein